MPTSSSVPMVHGRSRSKLQGQPLLYSVSIFLSIGVWLFGYDQGVMSGVITGPYFKAYFNQPTSTELGNMVAILEIGAFFTSLLAAPLADNYGRRITLRFGAIIFTIGGALQTATLSYNMMLAGRLIAGFGVGMLSMVVPIYQSEISPADHRGKLACIEFTGNIIGYASSVWIDYGCSFFTSDLSWRIPLFVQCLGGILLGVGSMIVPESPRYLVDSDQDEEGLAVIADFHGSELDDPLVREEFKGIKDAVLADRAVGDRSYKALWKKYKARVLLAMSAQMFAQLNGINVISYYAPLVFEQAGWIGRDAILMTGINALFYVASSIPPWYLVDRLGRKPILMTGSVMMAIALTAMGLFIKIDQSFTPNAVVICVIIFNSTFGSSWGPIPWLYPPEIFPSAARAKGVSISTATNWLFNYWVGVTTPLFQELIGWRLYPMHAFFCALSFIIVYFFYVETRGVPLEDMDKLFGDDFDDDEDEDGSDEEGDSGSDTSSFLANRGRNGGSSLPTSRKSSPAPKPLDSGEGLIAKMTGAVSGLVASRKRRESMRGQYNSVADQ